MNIVFLIGRIIFATFWLMGSFNHFKNLNYMSEYAKTRGTPSPKVAVGGTGVILLLGGFSMLLGVYPVVGIILLIVFLLGVSFQMHAYWKMDDAQMKQIDMINFTKNMAARGGAIDVRAVTAYVADESGDRVAAHSMCGRSLTAKRGVPLMSAEPRPF
jgi:putative oxidoreductase